MQRLLKLKKLFNTKKRLAVLIVFVFILGLGIWKLMSNSSTKVQYQTAQVEKGTLINSISASGNISTVGNVDILTQATGTIKKVLVKNGDKVKQGQKLAEIALDIGSQQKSSAAYASYLSAKNALSSAQSTLYSLDSQMWAAYTKFVNDALTRGLANTDPTFIQQSDDWLAAESKYKNQQNSIAQSQASLNSAWLSYQQLSPNITAPAFGEISNLAMASGLVIAGQTTSSTTSTTSQRLGTILTPNITPQATVNLSEIDAPKVKEGQKVTLTLDALPNQTFTGKVLVVNTSGQVSSGVTTYLATIVFDSSVDSIYPNMGVNAEIIIDIKTDVLLVPSSALQTTNGQTSVQILRNGKTSPVVVGTGSANDTQTEIISGLNEGDSVVTNVINAITNGSQSRSQSSSPFGGNVRIFGGGPGR